VRSVAIPTPRRVPSRVSSFRPFAPSSCPAQPAAAPRILALSKAAGGAFPLFSRVYLSYLNVEGPLLDEESRDVDPEELSAGISPEETERADARRAEIAKAMWTSYQAELQRRAV
jgi:hypothetical protein